MGQLTTHVLDTMSGRPARGVIIELFYLDEDGPKLVAQAVTNADGRCEKPLLSDGAFQAGQYELRFKIGDYYAASGAATTNPAFLGDVPVHFGVSDATANYHVPLLVAPYGYSTYRGS